MTKTSDKKTTVPARISAAYHCRYDELVDPERLVDHPHNANRHPERQLDALVRFIEFSGWRLPVIVSRLSGYIVAGHARKLAAIRRREQAPVVYQDFSCEADERMFLAADNKLAELAEIDVDSLAIEVAELDKLEVPVADFGFDDLIMEPPIERQSDEKAGASPWDRIGQPSDGVMFSFGEFHCRVSESVYQRFAEVVHRDNIEEWLCENCDH